MKKIVVMLMSFVLIMLISSLVLAAGGGGGGGSSSSSGSSSSGGSSGGSGTGPFLTGLKCDDKGQLIFQQKPKVEPVVVYYVPDGTVMIDVLGEWDGTTFTSDEALFVKAGKYMVVDMQNGNKTIDCPGFKFSCKIVNLKLNDCVIDDEKLLAHFTLDKADVKDLEYTFVESYAKKLTYKKGSHSKDLDGLKVLEKGNNLFELEVPSFNFDGVLQISHPACLGKYYVYTKINCDKKETKNDNSNDEKKDFNENSGKKVKCGGYVDINDRVKCRLQLSEKDRLEPENFLPEECIAKSDLSEKENCITLYRSVQECWDFPSGTSRINCVQRVLKLGDILTEKANCNALDSGKRDNCNKELKEKVYGLVKFRFYNLEEQAEGFMAEGKLSLEDLTTFVVKMEDYKLNFNKASSKEERKALLARAKLDWLELLKKVKK